MNHLQQQIPAFLYGAAAMGDFAQWRAKKNKLASMWSVHITK